MNSKVIPSPGAGVVSDTVQRQAAGARHRAGGRLRRSRRRPAGRRWIARTASVDPRACAETAAARMVKLLRRTGGSGRSAAQVAPAGRVCQAMLCDQRCSTSCKATAMVTTTAARLGANWLGRRAGRRAYCRSHRLLSVADPCRSESGSSVTEGKCHVSRRPLAAPDPAGRGRASPLVPGAAQAQDDPIACTGSVTVHYSPALGPLPRVSTQQVAERLGHRAAAAPAPGRSARAPPTPPSRSRSAASCRALGDTLVTNVVTYHWNGGASSTITYPVTTVVHAANQLVVTSTGTVTGGYGQGRAVGARSRPTPTWTWSAA